MKTVRHFWQHNRQAQVVLLVVMVFAAGFVLGHQNSVSEAQAAFTMPPEAEQSFEPFWQVYNMIETEYIDKPDAGKLVDGAISGMIDSLGDQYSGYMNPELYPLLNDDIDGVVEGIGALVRTNEDTKEIEIVNVMEGTPAMRAGIMSGDVFVAVNGESVEGLSQLELVGKVRGPAGTKVNLTMRRGDETKDFTIVRARIQVPNIESKILDHNVAYIKLYEFSTEARKQIDQALDDLDVNSRAGLIIDLRGNPGGLLNSAIDVTSAFVKDGVILIEQFGDGRQQELDATGEYGGVKVPIVVLVDESSASASELMAGALQDHKIATIIGETTLGKGTVQTWAGLVNGGGLRLTIARWLTPNGNWIHEKGITPDIVVEWTPQSFDDPDDPQLAAALDYMKSLVAEPAVTPPKS